MALFILDESYEFPPPSAAEPDGLLAIGGDLSPERLENAYRSGIFPWYDEGPILWWCPDPRFVLFPEQLKVSKSMRPVLNQNRFQFRMNTAFTRVMEQCSKVERNDQLGTWINDDIVEAYSQLHSKGLAHSAETWLNGELVGGLYGVKIGRVFFGESMFSLVSNASKFAFIRWVQELQQAGVVLIDCQIYTEHLESLGATMISRESFLQILQLHVNG